MRQGAVFRALQDEWRSTLGNAVGQPHGGYDYMSSRMRINYGMERSLTGSNREIADVRTTAARSNCSEIRAGATMMPGQYTQDCFAVGLAGVQARAGSQGEGQCAVAHRLRKLDRSDIQ